MKILLLSYSLDNGGAEKFVIELGNKLSEEHKVLLVTYKPNTDEMLPPKMLSEKIINWSLNIVSKKSLRNWSAPYNLIRKEEPDVVHVHSSLIVLYLFIFPVFFKKIRFVHTIHNSLTQAYEKLLRLFSISGFVSKKWIFVCISKNIHQLFISKYKKITFEHIDNGITPLSRTNHFEETKNEINRIIKDRSETKILCAIGNYSDLKRFDLLMEVMNYFFSQKKSLHLMLIGKDNDPHQKNFNRVNEMKNKKVFILGLKQNVADYLFMSDALIMSSSNEGMPLVILEAMSLGKPVITPPAGGVVDIVKDGINGYIARDLSKEALIDTVFKFLEAAPETINQICQNNQREFQEKYSIEICARRYLNLYKNQEC